MNENSEKENGTDKVPEINQNGNWDWEEPTNEEFELLRKNLTFYRIYTIVDGKSVNLFKFWHKNEEEALRVLNTFKECHPKYGDNCFYSTSGYVMDPDGTRHDTLFEDIHDKDGFFTKIHDFFVYSIPRFVSDFWFKVKDTIYFIRHDHSMKESWSLDTHLLEDLKFNLKKLSESHTGCPNFMCDRARAELKKPVKDEWDYEEDEMKLASKMWSEELNTLRENVLLYEYYSGYGIVSDDDKDMKLIEMKYKDTLPYKPGTNKGFDYEKLNSLAKERWENIWNWIKEYGESLWD